MEAYEMLLYPEGVDPSIETIHKRELIQALMMRAGDIGNSMGDTDIAARIHTELMAGYIIYPSTFDYAKHIYAIMFDLFNELNYQEKKNMLVCLREIVGLYGDDLITHHGEDKDITKETLESYLKLKVDLDTVSPEISEEIDRLTNMTDEEFQQEMEKEFGSDDDDENEKEDVLDEDENGNGLIAYEEPAPDIELEPLTEPIKIPDTTMYDPEYDIPDEKLYPNKD